MTIQDLKTILMNYLGGKGRRALAVNQEIVNQIIGGKDSDSIDGSEVLTFQIDGTTIFVSDAGLPQTNRVVFVDLKSRNSFLQELE